MIQINHGFKEYYYLDGLRVFNKRTNKYLSGTGGYTLIKEDNSSCHTTINSIIKMIYGSTYAVDNIEPLPNEEWKQIKTGFPYFVSNMGRVKTNQYAESRLLSLDFSTKYPRVFIDIGYGFKHYLVHKLVASCFLEQPTEPFMEIHHIDSDKSNNRADNLCYLSHDEHVKQHLLVKEKNKNA